MNNTFELSFESRDTFGKANTRRLRRMEDKVPAVIYGTGKPAASIQIDHKQIARALQNEAFYSHILTLKSEGKEEKVVLKGLHRHPSKPVILHADFLRVSATEKLTMHVPLHFLNEAIAHGVKLQNGIVSHMLNEVEIRCLPADLPEYIEIDLKDVKLDEIVHLSDLKLPKGVELVALSHDEDLPVASIHKLAVVEEPEGPVVAPAAEVPVIGKEAAPAVEEDKGGKK